MTQELLLRGGHVIDPSQGIDRVADVRFVDGVVAEVGPSLAPGRAEVRDVSGCLVTPGLIDLHTHVYWGGTAIGVDATALARKSATAVFVDAGTAGPGNFLGFRKHVIEPSRPVRIVPLLNLSFPGIFAFSKTVMVGESEDVRLLDIKSCVAVAREHADMIVGIKVRVGRNASGAAGEFPLDMALEVAEETGLPLMAHLDHPPPSRRAVMERLRPGDILSRIFDKPLAIMSTSSYRAEAGTVQGKLDIARYITTPKGEIAGRVLLVDDVLATGGTAAATVGLIERLGGTLVGVVFVIELGCLAGRAKLGGRPVRSVITYA